MTTPTSNDPDPAALLRRWQEHDDRDALHALIMAEISTLKQRLRGRREFLGGDMSVSDVAQESVARLLQRVENAPPPQFATTQHVSAYLWRTAWHLLVDRVRGRQRLLTSLDHGSATTLGDQVATTGGLGAVEANEISLALKLSINLLRPDDRTILELFYFQGMNLEAAARELGIEHGAAKMRLDRARDRLATRMRDWAAVIE